jgi:hypothetical protein
MSRKYRNFTLLVLLCVLALATGLGASPPAAGLTVYVDNPNVANGSVSCPSTPYLTIETGVAAFNGDKSDVNLVICPGLYDGFGALGYDFDGYTNLKITGRGNPTIQAIQGFTGPMIQVLNSSNVTIEGLTIDGHGHLGNTRYSAGIEYDSSYGIIKGNTITAWHQLYVGAPPFNVGPNPAHSIVAKSVPFGKSIKIQNNTIYDSQDTGILIYNLSKAEVTNNRVVFGSAIIPFGVGSAASIQAGIAIVHTNPGVVVSNNEVISDADLFPKNVVYARGIMLLGTIGAKVTGNTVRGTAANISIEAWCDIYGGLSGNNIVSGNKLYDTFSAGIYVTSRNDVSTICGIAPQVFRNQITGNTIYTVATDNSFGFWGVFMDTWGTGVITDTLIKDNTIAGFPTGSAIATSGTQNITGTTGTNRILTMPPAGVYK